MKINMERLTELLDSYVISRVDGILANSINTGMDSLRCDLSANLKLLKIKAVLKGGLEIDCPECSCEKVKLNENAQFEEDCSVCNSIDDIAMEDF